MQKCKESKTFLENSYNAKDAKNAKDIREEK